jgi:glutamyl-tRNA synthetase/glutamyl-Q tRNA(Asp) synthetase
VTRFAPSPTGHLHLGHVVNALYVWGIARARGGSVLLRLEDHDRQRSKPGFEQTIMEDLAWLGLVPDAPMVRQSERTQLYQEQLARLTAQHPVYACRCSRKELARTVPDIPGQEMRYPGVCRSRNLEWAEGMSLRVVLDERAVPFTDARLGPQIQCPARQCGDLQLVDRLGQWTYQFAVAVDDWLQGVDLVIRGEDLLDSTGRQIMLAGMLGRQAPPVFLHHGLIRKPSGEKLSKAQQDTGIRELRDRGASPGQVLGQAAHHAGLLPENRALRHAEMAELFERALSR